MRKNRAFTLIELLLFFTIFAIFSSIAVPSFLDYQKKIRLQSSVELMKTGFQTSFSSSRSNPQIFGVEGNVGGNNFEKFVCDYPACGSKIVTEFINLRKNVTLDKNFEVKFLPPHGDLEFIGDELRLKLTHGSEDKTILIYKSSGLVTDEN